MVGKNKVQKMKCLLAALLAVCILATPSFTLRANATDISQNENKQSELEQKSSELNQKLQDAKDNTENQRAQKQAIDDKISAVQQQIDASNEEITALDADITAKTEQIAGTQKEIDKNVELLKQRLRAIYMAGETSTLDIILGATDFSDFMDKAEIVNIVSKHDTALVQTLNNTMASVQQEKASLSESRAKASDAKTELESQREELKQLEEESAQILNQLQSQQDSVKKDLDDNDAELQSIEAQIKAYYADLQRQAEEERRRQEAAQRQNNSGGSSSSSGFIWPLPGYYWISSPFGETYERGGSPHKGMDIAGGGVYGAPIVASASGIVYHAESGGWGGGYGSYVMLSHEDGYMTVYGHMSSVAVGTGEYVEQGQVIGYVGSTGNSTGPHLHFEVRAYGAYQNPANYVGG